MVRKKPACLDQICDVERLKDIKQVLSKVFPHINIVYGKAKIKNVTANKKRGHYSLSQDPATFEQNMIVA